MHTVKRAPYEYLALEEREMRRRVAALRRGRRTPGGATDMVDRDRASLFDAAAAEVVEQHREVIWLRLADRSRALATAKARVHEGTYGICAICGERIPSRRLRAIPTATRCVRCQERCEAAA